MTLDEAIERGYDPSDEPGRRPAGCGGFTAWSGPCGATDCPSCNPSSWDDDDDEQRQESA